jgi:predicted GNAT family N-acyltransferase
MVDSPAHLIFKIIHHGSPAYDEAVKLREGILRKPLGLTFSPEERVAERSHIQIAGFQDQKVVATAVLVPEGLHYKMQRVVVEEDLQNLGIGSKILSFCEEYGKDEGMSSIYCHARNSAVRFYLKNGYVGEGNYFNEDTIPHLKMTKTL